MVYTSLTFDWCLAVWLVLANVCRWKTARASYGVGFKRHRIFLNKHLHLPPPWGGPVPASLLVQGRRITHERLTALQHRTESPDSYSPSHWPQPACRGKANPSEMNRILHWSSDTWQTHVYYWMPLRFCSYLLYSILWQWSTNTQLSKIYIIISILKLGKWGTPRLINFSRVI